MSDAQDLARKRSFVQDGYCKFEQILDRPMLDELSRVTDEMLAAYSKEERALYRYQGSNIGIDYQHPVFARLFSWPGALEALRTLGFDHPKFWSGVLLSKLPHAPPLYWHQDWWAWHDAISSSEVSPQVFLMYYLVDTTPENGCLRVIPGTHLRRIPLHDLLPTAHATESYQALLDSPLFTNPPEAVDVPVKAGDLVIGDARLLHAAYANQTDNHRTCLTLWYIPDFDSLPERVQAFIAQHRRTVPSHLKESEEARLMEPLLPNYDGNVAPIEFNRIPGEYLRTGSPL